MMFEFRSNGSNSVTVDAADEGGIRIEEVLCFSIETHGASDVLASHRWMQGNINLEFFESRFLAGLDACDAFGGHATENFRSCRPTDPVERAFGHRHIREVVAVEPGSSPRFTERQVGRCSTAPDEGADDPGGEEGVPEARWCFHV